MKTLQEKMAEVELKHEEAMKKERLGLVILDRLPTRVGVPTDVDWRVFVNTLYGRVATVTRKTANYEVTYKKALPWSVEDLEDCLRILPPIGQAHLKYTFVTFTSMPVCEELQKEIDKHPSSKVTELTIPVSVDMNPGDMATFEWFNWMEGIGVVQVKYPVPWQHKWMRHDWRRVDHYGGFTYQGTGSGMKLPGLDLTSSVNWGRGSKEYMGRTTLYWTKEGLTTADLIEGLRKAEKA